MDSTFLRSFVNAGILGKREKIYQLRGTIILQGTEEMIIPRERSKPVVITSCCCNADVYFPRDWYS